jgi:hypothetical protein
MILSIRNVSRFAYPTIGLAWFGAMDRRCLAPLFHSLELSL